MSLLGATIPAANNSAVDSLVTSRDGGEECCSTQNNKTTKRTRELELNNRQMIMPMQSSQLFICEYDPPSPNIKSVYDPSFEFSLRKHEPCGSVEKGVLVPLETSEQNCLENKVVLDTIFQKETEEQFRTESTRMTCSEETVITSHDTEVVKGSIHVSNSDSYNSEESQATSSLTIGKELNSSYAIDVSRVSTENTSEWSTSSVSEVPDTIPTSENTSSFKDSSNNTEASELAINDHCPREHRKNKLSLILESVEETIDSCTDNAIMSCLSTDDPSLSSLPTDTVTINVAANSTENSSSELDSVNRAGLPESQEAMNNNDGEINVLSSDTDLAYVTGDSNIDEPPSSPILTDSCTITPLPTDTTTPASSNPSPTPLPVAVEDFGVLSKDGNSVSIEDSQEPQELIQESEQVNLNSTSDPDIMNEAMLGKPDLNIQTLSTNCIENDHDESSVSSCECKDGNVVNEILVLENHKETSIGNVQDHKDEETVNGNNPVQKSCLLKTSESPTSDETQQDALTKLMLVENSHNNNDIASGLSSIGSNSKLNDLTKIKSQTADSSVIDNINIDSNLVNNNNSVLVNGDCCNEMLIENYPPRTERHLINDQEQCNTYSSMEGKDIRSIINQSTKKHPPLCPIPAAPMYLPSIYDFLPPSAFRISTESHQYENIFPGGFQSQHNTPLPLAEKYSDSYSSQCMDFQKNKEFILTQHKSKLEDAKPVPPKRHYILIPINSSHQAPPPVPPRSTSLQKSPLHQMYMGISKENFSGKGEDSYGFPSLPPEPTLVVDENPVGLPFVSRLPPVPEEEMSVLSSVATAENNEAETFCKASMDMHKSDQGNTGTNATCDKALDVPPPIPPPPEEEDIPFMICPKSEKDYPNFPSAPKNSISPADPLSSRDISPVNADIPAQNTKKEPMAPCPPSPPSPANSRKVGPPPPATPPSPVSPPLQLMAISPYGKLYVNRSDLPLPPPEEEIRKAHKNVLSWGWIQPTSETLAVYTQLRPVIQIGPQCGLVALSMASQVFPHTVEVSAILQEAKSRGYTTHGEMFSCESLAYLANWIDGMEATVERDALNSPQKILHWLLQGDLILASYDAERNHMPGLHRGHRAHWGVICGCFVQSSELDMQMGGLARQDLKTDHLWHLRPRGAFSRQASVSREGSQSRLAKSEIGSPSSQLSPSGSRIHSIVPEDLPRCPQIILLIRQGKSRNLIMAPLEAVQESNSQLFEYAPPKDEAEMEYVIGDVYAGLASKCIVLHKTKSGLSDLLGTLT